MAVRSRRWPGPPDVIEPEAVEEAERFETRQGKREGDPRRPRRRATGRATNGRAPQQNSPVSGPRSACEAPASRRVMSLCYEKPCATSDRRPGRIEDAASAAHRPVAWPHRAAARQARQSARPPAAGHPCRRHQRQGLLHGLPEGHAGGRRQARAHLHLAASRALPRAHRVRRRRRQGAAHCAKASWSNACCTSQRVNAGEPITFFEITTAAAFMAFAEHPADALDPGGGTRRTARCHQRRRAPRAQRDHAGLDGPHRQAGLDAWRQSRAKRPAS